MFDEVKGYFTSRFKIERTPRKAIGPKLNYYPLSHFKEKDLVEVVSKRDKVLKVETSFEINQKIATNLLEICFGHPKCVSMILDIESPSPRLEKGRLVNEKKLFVNIVDKVINSEILNNITGYISVDALISLCTFRYISPDLIYLIRDEESLKKYDLSTVLKCREFVRTHLSPTGLFSSPASKRSNGPLQMYGTDPVVRNFLGMKLKCDNLQRYIYLQNEAENYWLSIFNGNNVRDDYKPRGSQQIAIISEMLYHYCRILAANHFDENDAQKALETKLKEWSAGWAPEGNISLEDYKDQLVSNISNDVDIPLLIRYLSGNQGLFDLIEFINSLGSDDHESLNTDEAEKENQL